MDIHFCVQISLRMYPRLHFYTTGTSSLETEVQVEWGGWKGWKRDTVVIVTERLLIQG